MIDWIQNNDCYEEEGYGKYPVLGTNDFCYLKYDVNDDDEDMETLIARNNKDKKYSIYDYLIEPDTYMECRDDCYYYYFVEVQCAKTSKIYFLVSHVAEPKFCDEEGFFCIPAHSFNIHIFNTMYLAPHRGEE